MRNILVESDSTAATAHAKKCYEAEDLQRIDINARITIKQKLKAPQQADQALSVARWDNILSVNMALAFSSRD